MSIHLIAGKATNLRIKTAGYRKIICLLTRNNTFRNAAEIFNETYHRKGTSSELSYGTLAGDIEQEGRLIIERRKQVARDILRCHGFSENGRYPNGELPEEYRNKLCSMIILSGEDLAQEVIPGWKGKDTQVEQPDMTSDLVADLTETTPETGETTATGQEYSQPDLDCFEVKKHRRGKRQEVEDAAKEDVCVNFVKWFNKMSQKEFYGIIHNWQIEKNTNEVVYISIDAVLVDKQAKTRRKGGEKQTDTSTATDEEKTKKISHMNIKVEVGTTSYYLTSIDTEEAFVQLVALILANKLYKRYMVFFLDGEVSIAEHIKLYCGQWNYVIYLDWLHLEHKCFDLLSMAISGKRIVDPRGTVEYYSRGEKKGQIKSREFTSLSRLYARALVRILWVGNVEEAKTYLANIDPKEIKNPKERDHLVQYLENKKKWITCYALRKKAGLKNSSNGVENQNQEIVASRQKNNRCSWRPEGSSFLSAIATLFCNNESDEWFYDGKISYEFAE